MHNLALAVAPHEHVGFADSLVGLAGWLRVQLAQGPRSLDELFAAVSREDSDWPRRPRFEQVALAVTLLAAIGAARLVRDDRIALTSP
jgi:hypothetical protein